ncbi:hypothetical protein EIP91_003634 [Steccherinum ochraceum]|uniref:F-box domain-containing protein n=1 Tax=Steccherinum ochraceum TaxID=92696 RepID=A0A4R0RQS9_9APHY|nr:hypothetical protein EIP91_003634 [Steccherinum ochraceum]
MDILSLTDEVFDAIGAFCDVPELSSLSQVCRRLSAVFTTERFWMKFLSSSTSRTSALIKHNIHRYQPEGSNCKDLAVHLYRLYSHLRPGHKPPLRCSPLPLSRSVTWAKIVCHRWIIVASSDDEVSTLCLYDYVPDEYRLHGFSLPDMMLLTQAFLGAPVIRGVVFDCGGEVIIAVELCPSSSPSIEVLALRHNEDKIVFVQLGSLPDASHLRAADGNWVGMSVCKNRNIPTLWNWKTGRVIQLHDKPESQGGCMSMAIKDDVVAVAYRRKMRIYRIVGDKAELLCTHRYGASFQYSSMVALPMIHSSDDTQDTPMFALALGARDGIKVYHVHCKAHDSKLTLAWRFATPNQYPDDPHEPLLCDNGTMLTWLSIPASLVSRGTRLFLAQLPVSSGAEQRIPVLEPQCTKFASRFHDFAADERIPAMYWRSTRDLDDLRGLAVFGNAFGELAVCDFSSTSLDVLSRLFPLPRLPDLRDELVLSQKHSTMDAGYPFPLMATKHKDRTLFLRQAKKASSISSAVPPLSRWKTSTWYIYQEFQYLTTLLEVRSLYGAIVPLTHKEPLDVFRVGDLFVLFDGDDARCRILDSTSPDGICAQIDEGVLLAGRMMDGGELGITHVSGLKMHMAERRNHRLNRALKLRERGGHVDDHWMDERDGDEGRDTDPDSGFTLFVPGSDDSDGDSELGSGDVDLDM